MEEKKVKNENILDNSELKNSLMIENKSSNYYSDFMEKLGFTNLSFYVFTLASFLQWIW